MTTTTTTTTTTMTTTTMTTTATATATATSDLRSVTVVVAHRVQPPVVPRDGDLEGEQRLENGRRLALAHGGEVERVAACASARA